MRDPVPGDLGIQYWQGHPRGWGKERGSEDSGESEVPTYVSERRTVLLTEIGRRGRERGEVSLGCVEIEPRAMCPAGA